MRGVPFFPFPSSEPIRSRSGGCVVGETSWWAESTHQRPESARARRLGGPPALVDPPGRPEPVHAAAGQWASSCIWVSWYIYLLHIPLLFLPLISGHGTGSRSRTVDQIRCRIISKSMCRINATRAGHVCASRARDRLVSL
jgi:hypothetical protein